MKTISLLNLLYALIPLAFVYVYYVKLTNNKTEIIYATFRMVIQLLGVGYLLIYIFEEKNIFIGSFILLFMILISTFICIRNTSDKTSSHFINIFLSILLSGIFHLILIIYFILDFDRFYEPRYVIPIAGMIFANSMNVLSLCIERFEKEIIRNDSFEKSKTIAFKSAMIPQINSFLAVGLVTLPGMMTGQILSGIDPLIAVRYQIMIMSTILSSAGISMIIYFALKKN
ncbi:MAG: ABC transporter permease [Arcobacter sp.]|jgi:putative ABC transport system permease protein|uniref:ABC transporter permease n=1 Tax=Arcobacter sp. TaxID=1872629 RepID=UPI0025879B09|nr:ABC transporter permease [Arcobacter sp.]MDD3007390.1 ABC transporter permease [Arcobacter sp.]MDY3205001.1 ABC transporter permease [Arcobacter sp.]